MDDTEQNDKKSDIKPAWCLVANIVQERPHGPGGIEKRPGTKHFARGAKIYCYPVLWGDGYEQIQVIGRHRGSHRYVKMIIKFSALTNWRAELVYSPYLLENLDGVWGQEATLWGRKAKSPEEHVREYVEMMKQREAQ